MERDRFKYFRIEAREILEGLGRDLLELEKAPTPDLVSRVFRYAHTLKGAARVVKHKEIADASHEMEELLVPLRNEGGAATREQIDRILRLVDTVRKHVNALDAPPEVAATATAIAAAPLVAEVHRTVRADLEEMDAVIDGLSEVSVNLTSLGGSLGALERIARIGELLGEQLPAVLAGSTATSASLAIRVNIEQIRTQATAARRSLERGLDQTRRELGQVRGAVEKLRLLPLDVLFDALGRSVRDAATTLGKTVVFETHGADLRLDADVLGGIQAALMHLVRNAVAHGIESGRERLGAGKPTFGRIVVRATRNGSRVTFACSDDGRGIDLEKVRQIAVERGLVPEGAAPPAPAQLFELLMRGGISTSASVTSVAGRGVGLDAVRDVARRLGGDVAVATEAGRGTTVQITVASSRTSLEALLVSADGEEAAIPLDAIRRTLRVTASDLATTPEGTTLSFEGKAIPFAPLARSLRPRSADHDRAAWSVVVVDSRDGLAAVGVDRLLATEEVVVRSLPDHAAALSLVAGACLDEHGDPRPVLDVNGLVASVRRLPAAAPAVVRTRKHILVIDDSVTTRMLEQSILESAGYEVETASSAEEGLDKARLRKPALFLVDVEMPGMDGFTFVAETRADPELGTVPAILVTSRDAAEDRKRGETAGASGYIIKGQFDQGRFLQRIRELVGY